MAGEQIFLQNWIFTRFALPFLLVFFIVFAILEKTKLFGDKKQQLNALVAFVIGVIVVGVLYPVQVINNMILFLVVAIIVVFVLLLLWGFIKGEGDVKLPDNKTLRMILFIGLLIVVIVAVLWATGLSSSIVNFFSDKTFSSNSLITNILFIVVIGVALAMALGGKGKGKD